MKRLAEVGANGQWGIFSQSLPGRVGYQCSNYYRLLLQKGALKDDNYFIDEKGKAHYLFSTKKNADGTPRVDESEGQEGEGEGENGSISELAKDLIKKSLVVDVTRRFSFSFLLLPSFCLFLRNK